MTEENNLKLKIREWLSKEGYPLEFKVANIFRQKKFSTFQGRYVKDFKTNIPREIDVLAQISRYIGSSFLRIQYIVECKWTENKPWVIFTDTNSHISPSACIARSIATKTAEAILWVLAGDDILQKLSIFQTPNRPGFNGRQVFGTQNDLVFSTLQSVMSSCLSEKNYYERHQITLEDSLKHGVLMIPIIVIDGRLFETFYNQDSQEIEIEEKTQIRLHWKGSEAWNFHSTIDIVTVASLPEYANKLYLETNILMDRMAATFAQIKDCVTQKTLEPLNITQGSRGIVGLPSLLYQIKRD